jgi:hypothetical protein
MFKSKIATSVAIVLGILGTASAALAGQDDRNDRGGFVMPGTMDGVNPVYHPGYFPSASKVANTGNAGKASGHARGSYAQAYVRPSPNVDPNPRRGREARCGRPLRSAVVARLPESRWSVKGVTVSEESCILRE